MALKWMEGFELDRQAIAFEDKYATYAGPSSTGYTGRISGNAGKPTYLTTPSLGSDDEWVTGFGFKKSSSALHHYFDIYLGASRQLTLQFYSNGIGVNYNLRLLRGATVLATGTTDLAFDTWYFIELKALIDPSAGAYEVRINEALEFSDTGANTAESGGANADVFHFRNNFTQLLDDWYVCDTTGATNNDFLGDCQIEAIFASGAGDRTEFSAQPASNNWDRINDPINNYSTADYVYDDTLGQGDLYEFEDPGSITGTILGIALINYAALDAAGSRVMRNIFKTDGGGTEYDLTGSFTVASTDHAGFVKIEEENPDTSAAWTDSDLSNGQFGVEVVS